MAKKIKDIAVKTGSYTDNMGIEKGRYENVGVMMMGDDGNQFIILNRTFNPAGVPVAPGKDTVILSLFDPKDNSQSNNQAAYQQPQAAQSANLPQGQYAPSQAFQHPQQAPQGHYTNPNGTPMTPQQVQAARQNGAPY